MTLFSDGTINYSIFFFFFPIWTIVIYYSGLNLSQSLNVCSLVEFCSWRKVHAKIMLKISFCSKKRFWPEHLGWTKLIVLLGFTSVAFSFSPILEGEYVKHLPKSWNYYPTKTISDFHSYRLQIPLFHPVQKWLVCHDFLCLCLHYQSLTFWWLYW